MGIHQLNKVIQENAPKSIKKRQITELHGKTIAIDASLAIYQFLIAVRSDGVNLTAQDGEVTSHLQGLFYRTIRIVSAGIIPLFVFDGLPPVFKINELQKRLEKRDKALKEYEAAVEKGDKEKMAMYDKRKTKVTKKHTDDCQKLLEMMGVPFVVAPSEAEAYAALLVKQGIVDGVATEDMDALTFGAPILFRNLNAAENKKLPINEYNLEEILTELQINMDGFIDLCIILGCDYCPGIKGIGPRKALKFIKQYKSIEGILENETSAVPEENWNYEDARKIFKELSSISLDGENNLELNLMPVREIEVIKFLVKEKGFREELVVNALKRFEKTKNQKKQMRIDKFFKKKA